MTTHKQKKKKQREKEVKEKLYKRKMAKLKQDKYDKQIDADVWANKPKLNPYVKDKDPEIIKQKIERNLEILKGLEAEQEAEKKARAELNAKLSEKGVTDIKQALKTISEHQINNSEEVKKLES